MTASAERVMKAETFPDDCLELVFDGVQVCAERWN